MTKPKLDITWEHCTSTDPNNRSKVKCNYCTKVMFGGVNRMKHHLAGTRNGVSLCPVVDENVKQLFIKLLAGIEEKKSKAKDDECFQVDSDEEKPKLDGTLKSFAKRGTQKTMNEVLKDRKLVTRALCRLLYGEALPFNLVKSSLWKKALALVGEYGKGLKLPSYHEARVTYLKKEVDCVEEGLNKYKEEWKKTRMANKGRSQIF
ncbi:hypothetical protein OSB04_011474 [Centaurea solstitialis]|uniref:BED-type domain-containing protein n=1 Tax=Centaurea solstitialis TaxID=347529 RepID=A0AA38T9H6_9ASTR|nr:hypothetical protein OSB04_011474 [Centaurea solstitialis]